MGGGSYTRPDSSAGTESVAESDDHRPDTAESVHNEQPFLGQQQPPAQGHRQEPQRYHTAARQAQQPQGPQYKLQAMITGLERTGRKDPILRFDVHVSIPSDLSIL